MQISLKRSDKLRLSRKTVMGDILLGEEALADGLVDEIGTMSDVLERDFPGHKLKKLRRGEIGHGILKFFEPAVMKSSINELSRDVLSAISQMKR